MRLSTDMYCIIAVGWISDKFDHMKFGLPISTDTLSFVCGQEGSNYLRGLSDFVGQKWLPGACPCSSYTT